MPVENEVNGGAVLTTPVITNKQEDPKLRDALLAKFYAHHYTQLTQHSKQNEAKYWEWFCERQRGMAKAFTEYRAAKRIAQPFMLLPDPDLPFDFNPEACTFDNRY